jgi:hypothetical protein
MTLPLADVTMRGSASVPARARAVSASINAASSSRRSRAIFMPPIVAVRTRPSSPTEASTAFGAVL